MSDSDSFSLFDPSSHNSQKPAGKKKSPPSKSQPITPEQQKKIRSKIFQDPELKKWIERIDTIHKEIDVKLKELIEKQGHSPQSLSRYINDTKNFTLEQKKLIEKEKEALDKTLGIKLDPSLKKLQKQKVLQKASKEHRGKTLGSRKKWMDMR